MDYYGTGQGGGFMNDSPSASQGSPRDRKPGAQSLRPVAVRQLLTAIQNHGEADVVIDGSDASQVTVVGQVLGVNQQQTSITFKVDDGTGQMDAKLWVERSGNANFEQIRDEQGLHENLWVRITGNVKHFNNKRQLNVQHCRPVADHHEVYYALLDAMVAHLYYTRGPPGGTKPTAQASQNDPFSGLKPMERKIIQYLLQAGGSEDGVHIAALTKGLGSGVDAGEVSDALERLTESGHIYNTVDEYHYQAST